jgi:hypothetical protein
MTILILWWTTSLQDLLQTLLRSAPDVMNAVMNSNLPGVQFLTTKFAHNRKPPGQSSTGERNADLETAVAPLPRPQL